jgi:DNA-binding XRE family transcriptional regulator
MFRQNIKTTLNYGDKKYDNNNYTNNNTNNNNNKGKDIREYHSKLINELYRTIDVSRYRYKMLEYEEELPLLTQKKYLVAPNFAGKRVLVVFFKIMGRFMSYMIEKDTLKYNYDKINIEDVRLSRLMIRVKPESFNGTVFDAMFIHDKNNKEDVLLINDAYIINGKDLTNMKVMHKESYIKVFWNSMIVDDSTDNIKIMFNTYYDIEEINNVYHSIIPSHRLNYLVRGFAFLPEVSGEKMIFLFDNAEDKVKIDKKIKHELNTIKNRYEKEINKDEDEEHKYKVDEDIELAGVFQMRKTETPDIYHLYLPKVVREKDGSKKAIMTYFDVAFVNGMNGSKFCKSLFVDVEKVLVHCKFNTHHNKWEPIKNMDGKVKYPDKYNSIKDMLKKYIID